MSPLWVTCGSQVCGSEAVFLGGGCAAACGSTHTPMASMVEYCASEILRNHSLLRLLSTWQVRMNLIRLHMATHGYIIDLQDWFHTISQYFHPKRGHWGAAVHGHPDVSWANSWYKGYGHGMDQPGTVTSKIETILNDSIIIVLSILHSCLWLSWNGRHFKHPSNICVCVILCDHAWNMRPIHFSLHPLLPPGGKTRPVLSLMPVSVTRRRGHS